PSPDTFTRLPVLTRAEAVQLGTRLHGLSLPSVHGPTLRGTAPGPEGGRPLTIVASRLHAFFNDAYLLRDLLWRETDFRGKWARLSHDPATVTAGPRGTRERDWGPAISAIYATGPAAGFDSERPVADQAAWLARERPDYLSAPPKALHALAMHLRERKQKPPRLRALRCDGIAPPDLTPLCQEVFGVSPIVSVVLPETGCLALQCPEHGKLHVMAEGILAEIMDFSGAPCPPGQPGRLVVTPLHNFAMPLLRYDVGDYAEVGPLQAPCGRPFPSLVRVMGRASETFIRRDGTRFFPTLMARKLEEVMPLKQVQFAQTDYEMVEIRYVPGLGSAPIDHDAVQRYIKSRIGEEFSARLVPMSDIPRAPSG
ncbi:MAG: hypothetical protein ABUL68_01455, partial [Pseudomonadota bacterium]